MKEREYVRVCKECEEYFRTPHRYSRGVCSECKEKNHHKKRMRNLFNGKKTESSDRKNDTKVIYNKNNYFL